MRNVLVEETNREKLEFSLVHRVSEDLQAGIEYGADSNELYPMINYRLVSATDDTPAIIVGTSSAWPSGGLCELFLHGAPLGPMPHGPYTP